MKKAVIASGGKQYLVKEGDTVDVELLKSADKALNLKPLLLIDGDKVQIGTPELEKASVVADIITSDQQTDKVTSIRYKAKKRVRKVRGHRQRKASLKITKINA